MMKRSRFIPLSEIPEFQDHSDGGHKVPLTWSFSLPPHIDLERIGVDSTNLLRQQEVGAIATSHVQGYDGEVTTFEPSIIGITPGGEALMGLAGKTNRAEMSQNDQHNHTGLPDIVLPYYGKPCAVHHLNRNEIRRRVVASKEGDTLTDEQAWALQLNNALQGSFRDVSNMNLTKIEERRAKIGFTVANLMFAISFARGISTEIGITTPLLFYAFSHALNTAILTNANMRAFGTPLLNEKRWSLLLGGSLYDRALAVDAMTRVLPVIKYRP